MTVFLCVTMSACASKAPKAKPRVPLPLKSSVPAAAADANTAGMTAYDSGRYDEARTDFQQAAVAAPKSAEAHYNLGLALFALGENDAAKDHFIEAANLAPGDKVIWDSPALRPFSSPDPNIPKKSAADQYSNQRSRFGGGGMSGMGGMGR
jgi:tetratricopeptide (TPR) repeat protein